MLKRGSGSVVPSLAELEAEYWADPNVVARGQVELRLCDASARAPIAVLRFAGTLTPSSFSKPGVPLRCFCRSFQCGLRGLEQMSAPA